MTHGFPSLRYIVCNLDQVSVRVAQVDREQPTDSPGALHRTLFDRNMLLFKLAPDFIDRVSLTKQRSIAPGVGTAAFGSNSLPC